MSRLIDDDKADNIAKKISAKDLDKKWAYVSLTFEQATKEFVEFFQEIDEAVQELTVDDINEIDIDLQYYYESKTNKGQLE